MGNRLIASSWREGHGIPKRKTMGSAGYDFKSPRDYKIDSNTLRRIDTMIRVKIPEGHYGQLLTKSSMVTNGLRVEGGVVDNDYHGNIYIYLYNFSKFPVQIKEGDFIGQMVLIKCATPEVVTVPMKNFRIAAENLEPTELRSDDAPSFPKERLWGFSHE